MVYSHRLEAVDKVLLLSNNRPYNIIGKGALSNFPSFTMPYEYLLWWRGHAPERKNVGFKIVIWEKEDEIIIFQQK